jgi:hypothetical protein
MKQGLYSNIAAKRKRIAAGSGEKMNKVGSKKAPTAKDFRESAKANGNAQGKQFVKQPKKIAKKTSIYR